MVPNLKVIADVERYMVDVLLSSPYIPLDVNVIRLADVQDQEGVLVFPRSITVRFIGSSNDVSSRSPLVISRSMEFEVTISTQNHQNYHGHDYATYLLAAVFNSLINKVPPQTGWGVSVPFNMDREGFDGLTDSSHYVYTQSWSLTAEETLPTISIDPCIASGNCVNHFWSQEVNAEPLLPGEVIFGNEVYHLSPTISDDCSGQGGIVVAENGDWVYKEDNSQVYLTESQVSEGFSFILKQEEDTLQVSVRSQSGILLRTDTFCFSGKKKIQIFGFLNNRGQQPERFVSLSMPYADDAVVVDGKAIFYKEIPGQSEPEQNQVGYGKLMYVDDTFPEDRYGEQVVKAWIPGLGSGWLSSGTYKKVTEQFLCQR